jgi:hypothetical protein
MRHAPRMEAYKYKHVLRTSECVHLFPQAMEQMEGHPAESRREHLLHLQPWLRLLIFFRVAVANSWQRWAYTEGDHKRRKRSFSCLCHCLVTM